MQQLRVLVADDDKDAVASLTEVRARAVQGWVEVPTGLAADVLKCVAFTQQWLGEMFEDFGSVEQD